MNVHERAAGEEIAERVSELNSSLLKMNSCEKHDKKQQERQNEAKDDRADEARVIYEDVIDRFARIQNDEDLLEYVTEINSQF